MKPNKEVHHKKNGRIFDLSQNKHKASLPLPLREHQVQHNVSYIIAFEVLLILIRNQKKCSRYVAELRVGSPMGPRWVPLGPIVSPTSHGFQQDLFIFCFALKSTPDIEPQIYFHTMGKREFYSRAKATWE